MNLSQLEYLRELYKRKSFSNAAEAVGVTQPALSLQIQRLEEELDFKLIDRAKRPFEFTEEGSLFYEKAVDILKQVESLKDLSLEIGESIQGNLKVGIIPTLAPYLVPLFLNQLQQKYPGLQLEVFEIKTEDITYKLKMGKLDCGIISTPILETSFNFEVLFYERFFAYVSPKHQLFEKEEINADELPEQDIWHLDEGNCFQNQVNSICKINYQQKTRQSFIFRSSSIESLRRIIETQSGVTFVPELATINIPAEQENLLKVLKGSPPLREISMVTAKRVSKERQVTALSDVIKESIPKRMQKPPDGNIINPLL